MPVINGNEFSVNRCRERRSEANSLEFLPVQVVSKPKRLAGAMIYAGQTCDWDCERSCYLCAARWLTLANEVQRTCVVIRTALQSRGPNAEERATLSGTPRSKGRTNRTQLAPER